jgi:hypothetical protein
MIADQEKDLPLICTDDTDKTRDAELSLTTDKHGWDGLTGIVIGMQNRFRKFTADPRHAGTGLRG